MKWYALMGLAPDPRSISSRCCAVLELASFLVLEPTGSEPYPWDTLKCPNWNKIQLLMVVTQKCLQCFQWWWWCLLKDPDLTQCCQWFLEWWVSIRFLNRWILLFNFSDRWRQWGYFALADEYATTTNDWSNDWFDNATRTRSKSNDDDDGTYGW